MERRAQTIALAAVGSWGRYVYEELLINANFNVVVISRGKPSWLTSDDVAVHKTDYSEESMLNILNDTAADVLISFLNAVNDQYVSIHDAFLKACSRSNSCKRFIPSEWAGNIDDYPLLPDFYVPTRVAFREILAKASGVEWTIVNVGWFADYFLPQSKTHMPASPSEFPIDPNAWKAILRGTGNEIQSWVIAREAAKAIVELLKSPDWEKVTYIAAEWSTFNEAVATMERFYDRKMPVEYIFADKTSDPAPAGLDEWMLTGAAACPREKTIRQRAKYFDQVHFSGLEELLAHSSKVSFV